MPVGSSVVAVVSSVESDLSSRSRSIFFCPHFTPFGAPVGVP